ncbi:hypothetical protein VTN77DRAFT_112 [Rasamsonia byssochlamydoides]|uniref:uncharacterized protein n=1 Tax=Rasamsonia byssochlamydoides TaxID=89139 RepID=UPI00374288C4
MLLTYLQRRHVEEARIKETRPIDEVPKGRLSGILRLSSRIVMGAQVEAIGRHGRVHIAALFQQFPEELVVVCAAGHAAGHADDCELGLFGRPRIAEVVVLERPVDQVVPGEADLRQVRLDGGHDALRDEGGPEQEDLALCGQRVGDVVDDACGQVVEVDGASQDFGADLLVETAGILRRVSLARLRREERQLDATRAVAFRLGAMDNGVDVDDGVEVRCMAQAVVDWQRQMLGVSQDLRVAEGVLEPGRRSCHADRVLVGGADEHFGEFGVGLQSVSQSARKISFPEGENKPFQRYTDRVLAAPLLPTHRSRRTPSCRSCDHGHRETRATGKHRRHGCRV